jgi:hypothetical protein
MLSADTAAVSALGKTSQPGLRTSPGRRRLRRSISTSPMVAATAGMMAYTDTAGVKSWIFRLPVRRSRRSLCSRPIRVLQTSRVYWERRRSASRAESHNCLSTCPTIRRTHMTPSRSEVRGRKIFLLRISPLYFSSRGSRAGCSNNQVNFNRDKRSSRLSRT